MISELILISASRDQAGSAITGVGTIADLGILGMGELTSGAVAAGSGLLAGAADAPGCLEQHEAVACVGGGLGFAGAAVGGLGLLSDGEEAGAFLGGLGLNLGIAGSGWDFSSLLFGSDGGRATLPGCAR
jgi:hypothetical protein